MSYPKHNIDISTNRPSRRAAGQRGQRARPGDAEQHGARREADDGDLGGPGAGPPGDGRLAEARRPADQEPGGTPAGADAVARGLPHPEARDGPRLRLPAAARDHGRLCALPLQDPRRLARPGATHGGQRFELVLILAIYSFYFSYYYA